MKKASIIVFLTLFIAIALPILAEEDNLHSDFDSILQTYLTAAGVDYQGLKENRKPLDAYLDKLGRVSHNQFDTWNTAARLAFLINLYNAATLQLIIDHYPVKSIKDIGGIFKGPWRLPVVNLFGEKITLNYLEHKIIRVDFDEPRIHMALVCAAKGCPTLRGESYSAEHLDAQLEEQSKIYLASPAGMRIDRDEGDVYLSSVFKWYGKDFESVSDFVEQHSQTSISGLKVRWIDYDWALNGL